MASKIASSVYAPKMIARFLASLSLAKAHNLVRQNHTMLTFFEWALSVRHSIANSTFPADEESSTTSLSIEISCDISGNGSSDCDGGRGTRGSVISWLATEGPTDEDDGLASPIAFIVGLEALLRGCRTDLVTTVISSHKVKGVITLISSSCWVDRFKTVNVIQRATARSTATIDEERT